MDVFSSEKQQRYWELVEKISNGEGTYQDNQEVEIRCVPLRCVALRCVALR
jgi:hypothetical protein